jgi:uroporphyrin-III C-methyltransferase
MSTNNKTQPKLTIVGTGPGDADLITVKGVQAISSADVILYDYHVNTELLKYAPTGAKKLYVGKRNGIEAYTQDQLNTLIVDLAFTHGHVVRLYSGDPFVFGTASDEISHADRYNIQAEIVPGISGSTGVPGLQRIPVTYPGVSESYWVIAGTVSNEKLLKEIRLAAQSSATIVILRGLDKLEQIVEVYIELGKSDIPAAVIQNGSLPSENIALGVTGNIAEKAKQEKLAAPAVIIIGEVVKQHPLFAYLKEENNFLLN